MCHHILCFLRFVFQSFLILHEVCNLVNTFRRIFIEIILRFVQNVIYKEEKEDRTMEFAERLKELRTNRGLSQVELGKKLGLSNSTISMYERGEREPDYDTLELIGDYFNVDINYLLGTEIGSMYYLDPNVAEMAKELYEREELRVLFDASKNASPEDIMTVARMLKGLSKDE